MAFYFTPPLSRSHDDRLNSILTPKIPKIQKRVAPFMQTNPPNSCLAIFIIAILGQFLGLTLSRGNAPTPTTYGGIYTAGPQQPRESRTWVLTNKGDSLSDYPSKITGKFVTLLGRSLTDESKMVLIDTESGARRAIPLRFLDTADQSFIQNILKNEHPAISKSSPSSTPLKSSWHRYSKTKRDDRVRRFETEHFAFLYGAKQSNETALLEDSEYRAAIASECEEIWDFYEHSIGVPMPNSYNESQSKLPIYFYGTGLPGIKDQTARVQGMDTFMYPSQFQRDIPIFAHEFVHVIQSASGGFKQDAHHGGFREAHADWLALQWNPSKGRKAILDSARFTDFPLFSWQVSYGYWPLLQYLSETYGPSICVDVWNKNRRDAKGRTLESPLQTIYRLGSEKNYWDANDDWSKFADVLAIAASHKAYWDFVPQASYLSLLRERSGDNHGNFTRKQPFHKDGSWHSKPNRSPGQFGYHTIELNANSSEIEVSIKKRRDCNWRLVLIARDSQWNCRYSDVSNGDDVTRLIVEPDDQAWSLVVLAVPRKYKPHTLKEERNNRLQRYPFEIKISGAEPWMPEKAN